MEHSDETAYDVFICHSSLDDEYVTTLAQRLGAETFDGQPSGRLIRVFCDHLDILPGELFESAISRALALARGAIFLMSPELYASRFVQEELAIIIRSAPKPILPLRIRDEILDGPESKSALQHILEQFQALDVRTEEARERSYPAILRWIRQFQPAIRRRQTPPSEQLTLLEVYESFRSQLCLIYDSFDAPDPISLGWVESYPYIAVPIPASPPKTVFVQRLDQPAQPRLEAAKTVLNLSSWASYKAPVGSRLPHAATISSPPFEPEVGAVFMGPSNDELGWQSRFMPVQIQKWDSEGGTSFKNGSLPPTTGDMILFDRYGHLVGLLGPWRSGQWGARSLYPGAGKAS